MQTNLTWLDLSFNQIQKIEGLETLKHLTDLSLQDNLVSELEGLEELTKLQCFSIGVPLPLPTRTIAVAAGTVWARPR